jgi:FtsH-binding integral membrane protein
VAERDHPSASGDTDHQAGVREVLLVAAAVILTVGVAAVATALLPREVQGIVFHTPLLIVVLLAGTAIVLWRILRSSRT